LDFIHVVNTLRAELGHGPLTDTTVRQKVSQGAAALTQLATELPLESPEFAAHKDRLLRLYDDLNGQHVQLFDGMMEMISWCASTNIPWGIVTNKPLRYAEPLMQALALTHPANSLVCPDHVTHSKPHPESLLLAAHQLGLAPETCIYVGDHERDIIAGKAAGMYTVAALYGYIDETENPDTWGHDAAIQHSNEITDRVRVLINPGA
jgi:phosphoglycolate phosphatase